MAEFHEIAGYQVLATLGHGARSTIYAVRDKHGDSYALKRVVKQSPADQRFLDQAILEHEIACKFNHPVLRRSHKLIRQRQFIRVSEVLVLMEMVDGVTLEQHPPDDLPGLLEICRQTGEGLAAMHEARYVHADIKPNNIMIDREGQTKIIDFGQSCPLGTIKERIQGTPDYIAPEQVRRQRITAQTDVFNLGATLYWLLTRRHVPTLIPKGQAGISLRTEDRCPPPRELNEQVPPALSSLVMDCIRTEPGERPESMRAVLDRLAIAGSQVARQEAPPNDAARSRRNAS
ncbi:MAG: serine/threonine-protein kinase [Phycisphaeraceae bacterium]